jgi:hypothetical protein
MPPARVVQHQDPQAAVEGHDGHADPLSPGTALAFLSGYPVEIVGHHRLLEDGVPFLQKPFTRRLSSVRDAITRPSAVHEQDAG